MHMEAVLASAHALDVARDGDDAILGVLLEANRALDRAVDKGDCASVSASLYVRCRGDDVPALRILPAQTILN